MRCVTCACRAGGVAGIRCYEARVLRKRRELDETDARGASRGGVKLCDESDVICCVVVCARFMITACGDCLWAAARGAGECR